MQKIYSRINWENFPSEKTAVNESNLNRMDLGLDNLDDRVIALDAAKFNTETANTLIKDWVIDEQTGVITITKLNGEKILFDLNIEKIPVNFTLSDDGIITMTTDDGEQFTANIGAMIPILTFEDSDEIAVSVSGEGVNKTYSFSVKNGSITEEKLNPTYLGEIRTQVARAESSATSADASEKNAASSSALSKSYAVGGTGTRDGEDTDNAKYYAEQAKNASDVGALSEIVENHISDKIVHMTESEHDVVSKLGESSEGSLTYNGSEIKPSVATTESTGVVKPDGTTVTIDEDGTIHAKGKSEIKVDGTTITLDEAKGIISLAKTLQEKIKTIDDKLSAANVVNNQVTTENGFALDARQANPNIDGTLAKQITEINSNLTDLKYGEVSGGKNIFKNYDHYGSYKVATETYNGNSVIYSSDNWDGAWQTDLILKKGKTYAISAYVKGSGEYYVFARKTENNANVDLDVREPLNSEWTKITYVFTPDFDVHEVRLETYNGSLYISCFQIEEGAQATDYEVYTPSIKMLEERVNKSETTVNLLNPTLQTSTLNGVTCTNNGDGTYTFNGTATSTARFEFGIDDNLIAGKTYKVLGIPIDGSYSTILMGWDDHGYFNKEGTVDKKTSDPKPILMQVLSGYTCNNLVFKPMLTTNLSATYDDFVPYTGDTGRLNGDVAELKKAIEELKTQQELTSAAIDDLASTMAAEMEAK